MDILSKLRSYHVGKYSVFDTGLSLAGGYYFGVYFGYNPYWTAVLSLPVGEVVHFGLNVKTPFTTESKSGGCPCGKKS